jgi:hypothetical protein
MVEFYQPWTIEIFFNNTALSKSTLLLEFATWNVLWFVNSVFKEYIIDNKRIIPQTSSEYLLQAISAPFSITNSTKIHYQSSLFNIYSSELLISESKFEQIKLHQDGIIATSSKVEFISVEVLNLTSISNAYFMLGELESDISVVSSNFTNSTINLMKIRTSIIQFHKVMIQNISSNSLIFSINDSPKLNVTDFQVSDWNSNATELILVTTSHNVNFSKITATRNMKRVLKVRESTVQIIRDMNITNWYQGILLENSNITQITNSTFQSNGNESLKFGAAIDLIKTNATIDNSHFDHNTAISGAAISFECINEINCKLVLDTNSFSHNEAIRQGGAVYYDFKRPTFTNIEYRNNTALYGHNIASYPAKIRIKDSDSDDIILNNVGSGIVLPYSLELVLVDYDNQVMILDSSSQVSIKSIDTLINYVLGTNAALLNNGLAKFKDLNFAGITGSQNQKFQASSTAIDKVKIQKAFGTQISENYIIINFRFWQPGEYETASSQCQLCSSGSYSLQWNSTKCESCFENSIWFGGTNIHVQEGYWRRTTNSTSAIEWPNEHACLGGYYPEQENPVVCDKAYAGNLCTKWAITDNEKYQRISEFRCSKCPNQLLNSIQVILVSIVAFLFILYIIALNIHK